MKKTLICIVLAVTWCSSTAWSASRADVAAAEGRQALSVPVRTFDVRGGVPVTPGAFARSPVEADAGRVFAGSSTAAATLDAGMRFTMAGVICAVPSTPGAVSVCLRTSLDGRSWSSWQASPLELAAEAGGTPQAFTEPVWTGAARYAQVKVVAVGAGAPAALVGVRLVALDPTGGADTATPTLQRVSRASAKAASAPKIVTRRQWGADESLRGGRPSYAAVKMAFIHHTASGNTYSAAEAPAVMRGIYAYHTRSLGWSDIGYNFLIDRFGTIYEGRYGGMKRGVVGAQVLGFNRGSTGISVIGNFAGDAPPAAALASLRRLLAWKLKIHHLRPRGTAKLKCDASDKFARGAKVTFPVIAGHRQANRTECPGNIFYPLLPMVRLEASGRSQAPIIALARATPVRFSPNEDGALEKTTLSLSLTRMANWSVVLRDAAGTRLGSYKGKGAFDRVTWGGIDADGHRYADGVYRAVIAASSSRGKAKPRTLGIVIDTLAPGLSSASARPAVFSPNGDGSNDTAAVRYVPAEKCSIRVAIIDAAGKVRRRLTDWHSQSTAMHSVTWDGRVSEGGRLAAAAEGDYRFLIECRDAAGNASRKVVKVTLDLTLGSPTASPGTISPNGDGANDSTKLGFSLTRSATVRIAVRADGKTVRAFDLGALGAGSHEVVWDGADEAGRPMGSGRPVFTVTAKSSLAATSASRGLVVDRYRPRLSAPTARSVALGKAVQMSCTARDPYSAKVELQYTITDAAGATVAAASRGWVATGKATIWTWKPPARGVYTVTYAATDRGGNREHAPAATQITVP